MVVILQAVKRVVVSVAVDRAHGWTWGVAAVEIATMTHTGEVNNRASAEKDELLYDFVITCNSLRITYIMTVIYKTL